MKKKFVTAMLLFVYALCLWGCQDKASDKPTGQESSEASDVVDQTSHSFQPYVYVDVDGNMVVKDEMLATPDDVILAAYQMYDIANRNDQNCARRFAYSQCLVTTAGKAAKNVVYELKNGEEYLKYDFRPVVKMGFIKVADGYGYATYARLGLANAYFVDAGGASISNWQGSADFSSPVAQRLSTPTDEIYFHASQAPLYEAAGAVILPSTTRTASITHNDDEGFYTIEFVLDASNPNTTKNLLPSLRSSSSMTKDANYTSFVETFEIWDNGMFKHFLSVDEWKAGLISSTIHYDTTYSYTEEDCDFTRYNGNYYATIKVLCEQANAQSAQ